MFYQITIDQLLCPSIYPPLVLPSRVPLLPLVLPPPLFFSLSSFLSLLYRLYDSGKKSRWRREYFSSLMEYHVFS